MNKVMQSALATIVVLALIFFLGRLLMISGIEKQLEEARFSLETQKKAKSDLDAEYNKLKAKEPTSVKKPKSDKVLKVGDESKVLATVFEQSSRRMKIYTFEILKSFFAKNKDENSMVEATTINPTENFSQLDDQGMPIGASTDDEVEWPGVEIVPVKLTFKSSFKGFGSYLSKLGKQLPLHSTRSLDLIVKESGLVQGTIILNLPSFKK